MLKKNKKILVLGSKGFLGNSFSIFLKKKKLYKVINSPEKKYCDLTKYNSTSDLIRSTNPDFIINCSSRKGSMHFNYEFQADVLQDNIQILSNLYKVVKNYSRKTTIINILGNCSYPGNLGFQYEKEWLNGDVHQSVYASGYSNRFKYIISKTFFNQYKIQSINLLSPNIYGPGDHLDPNRTHALNGMIIRMLKTKNNNEKKFIVWGSGTPIREWLYIEDFTKILHIMLKRISHSIYPINIGQKKGYSIKFTANLIKKILKYDCKIIFDKNFSDGEPKKF